MTVGSETNRSGPYNGNGATTVFAYTFPILDDAHISVVKTSVAGVETVLTLAVDYIVSGVGDPSGGSIAVFVVPLSGEKITITRTVPFLQSVDLQNQGAYYAETIEDSLDLAVMRDQELSEGVARSLKIKVSSSSGVAPDVVLGNVGDVFVQTVNGIEARPASVLPNSALIVTPFMENALQMWDDADELLTASGGSIDGIEAFKAASPAIIRGGHILTPYDRALTNRVSPLDSWDADVSVALQELFGIAGASWSIVRQAFDVKASLAFRSWTSNSEVGIVKILQPGVELMNGQINSGNTGGIGLNMGGTNSPTLTNIRVHGHSTNSPAVGLYLGVVDSGTIGSPTGIFPAASEAKLIGCKTSGYFSKTAVWNMGSEVAGMSTCFFRNRHRSINARTYVGTANAECFEDQLGAVTSSLTVLPTAATGAKSNVCHDFGQGAILREADVNLALTGATQTNPVVVSFNPASLTAANLANGNSVFIQNAGGMVELNDKNYVVAGLNNGAGTFQLSSVDGTGYTAYTSGGTVNNRTGSPLLLEGAGLVNIDAAYLLGYGCPMIDFDMTYGGALRNVDISFQGEVDPLSAIFFTMDATARTVQGPFKINLLSAAQTYGVSMIDKTSGGTLNIDGLQFTVSSMAAVPPFQAFHLPSQFNLRNAQIEVPATGLMNAISGFAGFTGSVKVNGATPSMSFYGDVAVNGVTTIDKAGGISVLSYTAAQIGDITNAVNTADKRTGKVIRDSTNLRLVVANGATAGASWSVAHGTGSIVPV